MKKVGLIIIISFLFQFIGLTKIVDLVLMKNNYTSETMANHCDLVYGLTKGKIKKKEGAMPDLIEKDGRYDIWTYKGFIIMSPGTYRFFFYKNRLVGMLYEFKLLAFNTIISYDTAEDYLIKEYGRPNIRLEIYTGRYYYDFYEESKDKLRVQNGFTCIGVLRCFSAWETKDSFVYHIMGTTKGTISNPVVPVQYVVIFHKDHFSRTGLHKIIPSYKQFKKKGAFLLKNGAVAVVKEIHKIKPKINKKKTLFNLLGKPISPEISDILKRFKNE
ncbi:MAG: hypothetical protein ACP6IQ_02515 [Candidatus Njordarchaeia archaeon]